MTGSIHLHGKQIDAAVRLYNAAEWPDRRGKRVEVILKDDGLIPIHQAAGAGAVVNDKVNIPGRLRPTPLALATAPIGNRSQVP